MCFREGGPFLPLQQRQLKKDIAIVADPNIPEITNAVWHIHPRAKVGKDFIDYAEEHGVEIVFTY